MGGNEIFKMMSQKLLERFLHWEETGVASSRVLTFSDPGVGASVSRHPWQAERWSEESTIGAVALEPVRLQSSAPTPPGL